MTAKRKKSDKKNKGPFLPDIFPILSLWELLVAMKIRVFIRSAPNPYAHTLVMLHIKFDQDWPTDLRDMQV